MCIFMSKCIFSWKIWDFEFRESILPPVLASGGKIRRETGFSVLKASCCAILVPFEVRRTVFGACGMCGTKVRKPADCHKMGLASFGAKCGYLGRKGRRGRGGGGGQVRCRCMLPSGWVCCGVDRVMFRAVGGKSRNL